MSLADELREEIRAIFTTNWSVREGRVIPTSDTVRLGNDAVQLDAAVLYADLAESTAMVDVFPPLFAAEVYKAYLIGACRAITANHGEITAFDGDRVMAVFIGGSKNTNAANAALNISYCVKLVNEELKKVYPNVNHKVQQAVGIDSSELHVARTGIRGSNDLVWVGRAANYAAKLCGLRDGSLSSWITEDVYNLLGKRAQYSLKGENMWTEKYWPDHGMTVYASSWWRAL